MIAQRPATLTVTGSWGGWCLFPAVIGREEGYTLGRSSVTYHRPKCTCMGRTCKHHAARPQAGTRTLDLLTPRQQCYQLHHSAAQHRITATVYEQDVFGM
ncbi:hypothetical protein AMECASPLE_021463 [Ameca splendens]|uniref:Uncharacterized protein n=1 Tax=Ameca splendens TaxID=208324 RepID=A0ABV0ZQI7_9TELE